MATNGSLKDRSVVELVKELSGQASGLARQEVELAKAELAEKARKGGVGGGMIAGAAITGLVALGSLTAFLILVLALALPEWVAALIVTVLWSAVAAVLALQGLEKLRAMGKPVPEKTVETVKEDVQWLKSRN